ncbi:hypothetical protein ONZ45_g5081 [Pleurotus djamor]|nr:hypothetical protein ONZ45_g5081 [Pleurotus djamor]
MADGLDIAADVSHIAGNASPEVKAMVSNPAWMDHAGNSFAIGIARRINVTEVSIVPKTEEPKKKEAKVTYMLNGGGKIHGGCSATLVDLCTSYTLLAYNMAVLGEATLTVSQAINVVYHSPAERGDTIKIVSTTMSVGARAMSARCELWNATHHRLVASGVHITMQPSAAKPKL